MLEMMKELFGITHDRDDEEEVPNMNFMQDGEEEVSPSQPVTTMAPLEEEEVLVPQGLRQLPPKEEDIPVPLERPLSRSCQRKKSRRVPLSRSH
jgi:hypothetical protein